VFSEELGSGSVRGVRVVADIVCRPTSEEIVAVDREEGEDVRRDLIEKPLRKPELREIELGNAVVVVEGEVAVAEREDPVGRGDHRLVQ
jgi:hypothetical protein